MSIREETPPPAPLVLADMLAMHAWSPHLDQATKQMCGWAADTIREVVREKHVLSHRAEQLEGDNALLFHMRFGSQKGGAA
jgi:hypothetical protein